MIFHYINRLEKKIISDFALNLRNLRALSSIRSLLDKLDHDTEDVPVTSKEKLMELLSSLKEQPLTSAEEEMISKIISIKNKKP